MTLKAVVENLDDVDVALHDEYEEKDGKFYLKLDGSIRTHTAVAPLQNTLNTLKNEKKTLKEQLEAANSRAEGLPEDFDPAVYAEEQAELARLRSGSGGGGEQGQALKEQYEQRIRNLETKHAGQLAALEKQRDEAQSALGTRIVNDDLTQALVGVGVDKKFLQATQAMLKSSVKVVVDEDSGDRRAVVETDMGETAVADYVKTWAESDAGKVFITPATGGGAQGSGGGRVSDNPWLADRWNVTEQGRIYRDKGPEYAERLAKQAGTTIGGKPAPRAA